MNKLLNKIQSIFQAPKDASSSINTSNPAEEFQSQSIEAMEKLVGSKIVKSKFHILTEDQKQAYDIRRWHFTYMNSYRHLLKVLSQTPKDKIFVRSAEQMLAGHRESLCNAVEGFERCPSETRDRIIACNAFDIGELWHDEQNQEEHDYGVQYDTALFSLLREVNKEKEFREKWEDVNALCSSDIPGKHPEATPQPYPTFGHHQKEKATGTGAKVANEIPPDSAKIKQAQEYADKVATIDIDAADGELILQTYNKGYKFFESTFEDPDISHNTKEYILPIAWRFARAYECKSYGDPVSTIRRWSNLRNFELPDKDAENILGHSYHQLETQYLNDLDFSLAKSNCRFTGFFKCLARKASLTKNGDERISDARIFTQGLDFIDQGGLKFCYQSAMQMFKTADREVIFENSQLLEMSNLIERVKNHFTNQPQYIQNELPDFLAEIQSLQSDYLNTIKQLNGNEFQDALAGKPDNCASNMYPDFLEATIEHWSLSNGFSEQELDDRCLKLISNAPKSLADKINLEYERLKPFAKAG